MSCLVVVLHSFPYTQDRGIVPEVFQTPEKFHITVGVLRIFSQEEEASTIIVHVHVLYAHYMLQLIPLIVWCTDMWCVVVVQPAYFLMHTCICRRKLRQW